MPVKTAMRLWGGRFAEEPSDLLRQLGDSLPFDRRLASVDIRGSIAYAHALEAAGVLEKKERSNPKKALPGAKAQERAAEKAEKEAAANAPAEEEAPAEEAPAEEAAAEETAE